MNSIIGLICASSAAEAQYKALEIEGVSSPQGSNELNAAKFALKNAINGSGLKSSYEVRATTLTELRNLKVDENDGWGATGEPVPNDGEPLVTFKLNLREGESLRGLLYWRAATINNLGLARIYLDDDDEFDLSDESMHHVDGPITGGQHFLRGDTLELPYALDFGNDFSQYAYVHVQASAPALRGQLVFLGEMAFYGETVGASGPIIDGSSGGGEPAQVAGEYQALAIDAISSPQGNQDFYGGRYWLENARNMSGLSQPYQPGVSSLEFLQGLTHTDQGGGSEIGVPNQNASGGQRAVVTCELEAGKALKGMLYWSAQSSFEGAQDLSRFQLYLDNDNEFNLSDGDMVAVNNGAEFNKQTVSLAPGAPWQIDFGQEYEQRFVHVVSPAGVPRSAYGEFAFYGADISEQIAVSYNGVEIEPNGQLDFGYIEGGKDLAVELTIANSGQGELLLTGDAPVEVTVQDGAEVVSQPAQKNLQGGQSSVATVTLTPTLNGLSELDRVAEKEYSASVLVRNGGDDFAFTVQARVYLPGNSDGDELTNYQELTAEFPSDPFDADSDDDELLDHQEAALGTRPDRADTDGDGIKDGLEDRLRALGFDPLSQGEDAARATALDTHRNDVLRLIGAEALIAPNLTFAQRNADGRFEFGVDVFSSEDLRVWKKLDTSEFSLVANASTEGQQVDSSLTKSAATDSNSGAEGQEEAAAQFYRIIVE